MVEPDHPQLTIQEQCRILSISRSAYSYTPEPKEDERDITILQAILEELRERPFYGYRKVWWAIKDLGVTLKQVRRIMKKAGLRAVYASKKTLLSVERFWRSLKYEDIYLKDYQSMAELKDGQKRYFMFYNSERFYESLGYETPDAVYQSKFIDEQQYLRAVS